MLERNMNQNVQFGGVKTESQSLIFKVVTTFLKAREGLQTYQTYDLFVLDVIHL